MLYAYYNYIIIYQNICVTCLVNVYVIRKFVLCENYAANLTVLQTTGRDIFWGCYWQHHLLLRGGGLICTTPISLNNCSQELEALSKLAVITDLLTTWTQKQTLGCTDKVIYRIRFCKGCSAFQITLRYRMTLNFRLPPYTAFSPICKRGEEEENIAKQSYHVLKP